MSIFRLALISLIAEAADAALCLGTFRIDGLPGLTSLMGNRGKNLGESLKLQHNSAFGLTKSCQGQDWDPDSFTLFQLLGKTLSFTVDLRKVGCSCSLALSLVAGPSRSVSGTPTPGTCPWMPYYCDTKQICGQRCPELDIMQANSHVFLATPHTCNSPSPTGHYTSCDLDGCPRSTSKIGGDAYGHGKRYKINTMRPFDVHAEFHGSGLQAESATFTGLTVTLQQGKDQVVLDFSSCGDYLQDLAGVMAQGMSMHLTYGGIGTNTTNRLDQLSCGKEKSCNASTAGEASIGNIRIATTCKREIAIGGLGAAAFMSGSGGRASGNRLTLDHNSGFSVTSSCGDDWDPNKFTMLRLLGKMLSFTVDLSRVGCSCNLALYIINGPPRDEIGQPSFGTCSWSPYYCDSNQVCGQYCPEVDIMEANSHAFAATPHKCDAPSQTGHYSNCDGNGCGQNTHNIDHAYGPGVDFRIDTRNPFDVHTSFHGWLQGTEASFTGMTTVLRQGDSELVLDHSNCASYISSLTAPMLQGMVMRITYWGDGASTMAWLDQPPCGQSNCTGDNAGEATISNITISNLSDAGSSGLPDGRQGISLLSGFSWWLPAFLVLSCTQCSFLFALGLYAFNLYGRESLTTDAGPQTSSMTPMNSGDAPLDGSPSVHRTRSAILLP